MSETMKPFDPTRWPSDELEDSLMADLRHFGTAFVRVLPDGSRERVDPREVYVYSDAVLSEERIPERK